MKPVHAGPLRVGSDYQVKHDAIHGTHSSGEALGFVVEAVQYYADSALVAP
jgi:hypothetical protein